MKDVARDFQAQAVDLNTMLHTQVQHAAIIIQKAFQMSLLWKYMSSWKNKNLSYSVMLYIIWVLLMNQVIGIQQMNN